MNQFSKNTASITKQRSNFYKHPTTITTLKAGDIVPIFVMDTIPGSTVKIDMSYILRMLTPAVPVMDLCYFDYYGFWISYENLSRKYKIIVDENGDQATFSEMCGENKTGYWVNDHTYKWRKEALMSIGSVNTTSSTGSTYTSIFGITPQSVLNYLGLPILSLQNTNAFKNEITGETLGSLPQNFKSSLQVNLKYPCTLDTIYNEWFRNENVKAPTKISQNKLQNSMQTDWGTQDGWTYNNTDTIANYPYKSNILGGYFESALPEPIKATSPVEFNLGGLAPVTATVPDLSLKWTNSSGTEYTTTQNLGTNVAVENTGKIGGDTQMVYTKIPGTEISGTADLSEATSITIEDLRKAIAIQHMEEKLARSGSRYIEFLQAFYGVHPSNRNLERPEYLGGQRDPVNISQVVSVAQTSESDIGELGAYSYTGNINKHFINKSFDEWGVLMIVCTIRTKNKYFEGIPREWSKENLEDLYIPELENIGDQAIYTKELDIFHNEDENTVFGYQERYGEYKNTYDTISGYATPDIDPILGLYNFQTRFEGQPYLNEEFETQQYDKVAKTLLESKTLSQFLLNVQWEIKETAPMKKYSIPGMDTI